MRKQYIFLANILFFIGLIQFSYGQPETSWTKTFGGNSGDYGYNVQQTTDGGYIITAQGHFNHWDYSEGWLIKTDVNGNAQWIKTDTANGYVSAQQTPDGGYIILGNNVSLMKTDDDGRTIWRKTYGGGEGEEYCGSIHQTTDGGYIITGSIDPFGEVESDVLLIKTDANGDTMWTKTYGGSNGDWGNAVQQTTDGGYIIIGSTESFGAGGSDIWLIKVDAEGETMWTKTFGGNFDDYGGSIQQTTDGGYIIVGSTNYIFTGIPPSSYDAWLIKTDANGDTLWTKIYGTNKQDDFNDVHQTSDGGYIIIGSIDTLRSGEYDVWLVKTDANGDEIWSRAIGGSGWDVGSAGQQTIDGGYVICGSTDSFGNGDSDIWLIKVDADLTAIHEDPYTTVTNYHLLQNYPNPFNPSTMINYQLPMTSEVDLSIYNLMGQKITTLVLEKQSAGTYGIEWNARGLPSGIYMVRLKAGDYVEMRKMILQK